MDNRQLAVSRPNRRTETAPPDFCCEIPFASPNVQEGSEIRWKKSRQMLYINGRFSECQSGHFYASLTKPPGGFRYRRFTGLFRRNRTLPTCGLSARSDRWSLRRLPDERSAIDGPAFWDDGVVKFTARQRLIGPVSTTSTQGAIREMLHELEL